MQNYKETNQKHVLLSIKTQQRVEHPLLNGMYELFAQIKSVSNETF